MKNSVRVLFVCMGNICRSPLAHGVFESMVATNGLQDHIFVDSCGTHAYHIGEKPDPRSQQVARQHQVDLSKQRARQVRTSDFSDFDHILVMDNDNYQNLINLADEQSRDKIELFLHYAPNAGVKEVPDPYYGGPQGFGYVYDLVQQASSGLLQHIRQLHRW